MQVPEGAQETVSGKLEFLDAVKAIAEGNTLNQLLLAGGILVGGVILLLLMRRIVSGRLHAIAVRTKNRADDLAAELIKHTHFVFLLLAAAFAAALALDTTKGTEWLIGGFGQVLMIAFFIQGGLWGNRSISFWLTPPADATDRQAATARILQSVGFLFRLAIWLVVLLMALKSLGFEISTLLAGLGIGGIAVALALQNVLGDLFASISIVLDRPFSIGDYIIVGDLSGTVERIGLKTTRVRSLSGEQLIFANSDLLGSRIRNYKKMEERRVLFSLGVTYGTSGKTLQRIPSMLEEIIGQNDRARFDRAHFKEFGDSALSFEVVYYMEVPDYAAYMDTQQAINLAVYRKFESEGIEFAYPTQTIHLERPEGASS